MLFTDPATLLAKCALENGEVKKVTDEDVE